MPPWPISRTTRYEPMCVGSIRESAYRECQLTAVPRRSDRGRAEAIAAGGQTGECDRDVERLATRVAERWAHRPERLAGRVEDLDQHLRDRAARREIEVETE